MAGLAGSAAGRRCGACRCLAEVFGFPAFRGQQEAVIGHVIGGGDALVLMPTGGGKSLCYQIPALVRPARRRRLAADRADEGPVDALRQAGVRAAYLNSTLSAPRRPRLSAIRMRRSDLVYVAPERLMMPRCLDLSPA